MNIEKKYSDNQRKAALALNLCTVSVSQIVDYEDINIMKQEYDSILNNLNLQHIIKDEPLLNSLKAILDTVTFYLLLEGDKDMAEKEYQHKIKNAIWDSASSMGFMFAGGHPTAIAAGVVMQAGICYLNYRRSKAQSTLAFEKQQWQLQRSAIEQLNGLRRSLFETAWRLSDAYDFPDEWRLTEKQISQYNKILMDPDPHRMYDRLGVLDDAFEAFPPFWYQKSRAALETSVKYADENKIDLSNVFKQKSLEALDKYDEVYFPLMREDIIAASAALDKIALLNPEQDKEKILALLDRAQKMGGSYFDVLQLCAVNYISLQEAEPAIKILRNLVNEEYNTQLNGRLLSRIYNELDNKLEYQFLCDRIGNINVMPWADSMDAAISKLIVRDKKNIEELAFTVFQKVIATQTQKLSTDFYEEFCDWERNFSDDKLLWKDKVASGESFDLWASTTRQTLDKAYNDFSNNKEFLLIFRQNKKLLREMFIKIAKSNIQSINKLDNANHDFQNAGLKIKEDTSMMGISLYKLMDTPKSSLMMEYKLLGDKLLDVLKNTFEEIFQESSKIILETFCNDIKDIESENDLENFNSILENKVQSISLPSVSAFIIDNDKADDTVATYTDHFGSIIFDEYYKKLEAPKDGKNSDFSKLLPDFMKKK